MAGEGGHRRSDLRRVRGQRRDDAEQGFGQAQPLPQPLKP